MKASVLRSVSDGIVVGASLTPERSSVDELLELFLRRPAWMADAACREHPEVSWFPDRGQSNDAAKEICASCLVRCECLDWALTQGQELQGVWGSQSQRERHKLLRERRTVTSA